MGEEIDATGAPRISVEAVGTAPIERVELFRGMTRIHSEQIAAHRQGSRLRVLFSGARVRGRGRSTLWDGRLALSEARILEVESVAFVENRDGILESTESGISWSLYTAGDSRGFNLEFDGEDGEMKIQTKHAELEGRIRNFLDKSAVVDAGRLGQRIEVGKTPAMDGPWEARFEYIDNDAPSGLNSYWVRVVQVNQEKAWSSPVWVNLE